MSLAARALARKLAKTAFDFEAAQAAKPELPIATADEAMPGTVEQRPLYGSIASRKRLRLEAAQLATLAANDNGPDAPEIRADVSAYELMRLQLREHRQALKAVQSLEKKIELKREFLPVYDAWISGALSAAAEGHATQDDVVAEVMIWRLDVGDFEGGLALVDHSLKHNLVLPERFNRTLATYAAETVAEAAIAAFNAKEAFPHGVIDFTQLLVDGRDMPDQVRAKLFKAQGLELAHLADNPVPGQDVASWRPAHLTAALEANRKAMKLDVNIGLKRACEILERELKKEQTP